MCVMAMTLFIVHKTKIERERENKYWRQIDAAWFISQKKEKENPLQFHNTWHILSVCVCVWKEKEHRQVASD